MIDRTAVPYLAGFVLCVGSVLALAACTQGGDSSERPAAAVEVATVVTHAAL